MNMSTSIRIHTSITDICIPIQLLIHIVMIISKLMKGTDIITPGKNLKKDMFFTAKFGFRGDCTVNASKGIWKRTRPENRIDSR